MLEITRNLMRRKLRSILTISGIVIGIFALTTMGAMAEHFNSLLDEGIKYFSTTVSVGAPVGQQAGLLPMAKADEIRKVSGVQMVDPNYSVMATPGGSDMSFGAPNQVANEAAGIRTRTEITKNLGAGTDLTPGVNGQVVMGGGVATIFKVKVGDTVYLPKKPNDAPSTFVNHPFKVVGTLPTTGNWTDSMALVSTADAQMLVQDSLPAALQGTININNYAQGFTVYGKPGAPLSEMDALAARINSQVPGIKATRPSETVSSFKSTGTTFTAIITGAALLALLIGGLSVVNTMIMAVTERVREIGLKKALGAHTGDILREYLMEATLIGLVGGIAGYAIGLALTSAINFAGQASNTQPFLVTPRLTVLGIGFAVGMAALAGVIPALRAARMDPVAALRTAG